MKQLLKQGLLGCLLLFALVGQAMADPLANAKQAYFAGDYAKAEKLFRPLAEQGNASAQLYLGSMYDDGQGVPPDHREAVKWYRLAALQGNAHAQYSLGELYEDGEGVEQSYKEAVKWFRLAAAQGHANAQNDLGLMHATGQGVPLDYVRAHMWFSLALAKGASEAQQNRDTAIRKMKPAQIERAQQMARECEKRSYKNCD